MTAAGTEIGYGPARPEDAEAILAFAEALVREYEDMARIDPAEVFAWMRRKVTGRIGEYVRVTADGKTAAYYRFAPAAGRMELDDLYVLPECRGRGIGSEIVRRCCAATDLPVFLYVFRGNGRAVALYERLGFRITEEVGETRLVMQRDGAAP